MHKRAHVASPRGERLPAQVADHLSDAVDVMVPVVMFIVIAALVSVCLESDYCFVETRHGRTDRIYGSNVLFVLYSNQ